MRIDSSGNILINETSINSGWSSFANVQITHSTASGLIINTDTAGASNYCRLGFTVGNSTGNEGLIRYNTSDYHMSFWTNAGERMRIDSSGNVGIGKSNPNRRLSVKSSGSGTTVFNVLNSGDTSEIFLVNDVSGSGRLRSRNSSNTTVFQVDTDGDVTNTNNSYGAISDERLKSNIVDASSQLDDVMAVQVKSYTLNSTGETHIGVVAQDLEASGMSGLVQEDEDGIKSVKYSVLYMKAIKAIQEQQAIIEDLQTRLSALEAN